MGPGTTSYLNPSGSPAMSNEAFRKITETPFWRGHPRRTQECGYEDCGGENRQARNAARQ